MRLLLRILLWPFRILRLLSKSALILLFVAAMALNVAALTSGAVFSAVSGALAASGLKTVEARQTANARKLTRANGRLVAANARLASSGESLRAANRDLKASSLRVASEKRELAQSTQRMRKSVSATTAQVSRRTLNGAGRNIAAMAGEATPGFGLSVIIATTVWEIYDACESLKDLHALDAAINPESADPADRNTVCAMQVPTSWAELRKVAQSEPAAETP